ncbi:hypothetical protein VX159_02605 [Dechloromonas sp. ZY10]|uniref:hypothetical protein n=1 Tax=Dechloromonas aquae TaxID=2664436 RepID=UPI003529B0A7
MAKKCCRSDPPCKHCPKRQAGKSKGKHVDCALCEFAAAPAGGRKVFPLRAV